MDEDDMDGGGFSGGGVNELAVERRTTDRLLNDLRTNGYRDARQKFMEDETLMQAGFDAAYTRLVKLGFSVGRVRASVNTMVRDSAILAAVNHRLDGVESFAYDAQIEWPPNADYFRLVQTVNRIASSLDELVKEIKSTTTNTQSFIAVIGPKLAHLDAGLAGERNLTNENNDNNDDELMDPDRKHVDNLNDKIFSFSLEK